MKITGVIVRIHKDRAIIRTDDNRLLAVKRHNDMMVGQIVSFDANEVHKVESKKYKYAASGKRIEKVQKTPKIKNFSRINNIKEFSRVDDIKNFSRVAATKETSQDSPQESKVENFSRVVDFSRAMNFSRVSNSKKNEIKNFSRISNIKNFSRIASIAAAFVLIFLFGRNVMLNNSSGSEYAYVSVDVNPSVEFTINSKHKVIVTSAINQDASEVLDGLELKEKDLKSALVMVLEKAESLGYISDDKNYVLVSMALNDKNKKTRDKREEKIDELKETIEQGIEALDNDTIVHRTVTVDLEERNKALENELSMGRYYLYLEAKEKGMDITIDEVKSSKISDLIEKIEDNTELAPTPTPVPPETPEPTPTPTASEATPSNSPVESKSPEAVPELGSREIEILGESVVLVTAYDENRKVVSQGSGFAVGTGLFATNYHLVKDGVVVKITAGDGKVYDVDGIVKYDKAKDLALLKTTVETGVNPLKLGTKKSLTKGSRIVAIGKANGAKNTVTKGSIKSLKVDGLTDAIELSASISKESTGGPVFDMKGNVVGITAYGISKQNVNAVIPADYVADWVKELSKHSFGNIRIVRKTLVFDSDFEFNFVVYKIIRALENEDAATYFGCMTDELYKDETRKNLEVLFTTYDLAYNIESINVVSKSEEQAKVSYVYTINKEAGPNFKNYRIIGECSLIKVDGTWKINDSEEKKEYIQ